MNIDPALILGPYGAVILLLFSTIHLYRENTALRKDATDLLKRYQERDEEERKYLKEQEAQRRERLP